MTEQLPLNTAPLPVKLRVEDYLLLDESGALADYAKTELIEGGILYMNAQHTPHARFKSQLFRRLADALDRLENSPEAIVEASIAMPPFNTPEPDVVLTYSPESQRFLPLGSIALVIEVSDTTLAFDLREKSKLYARFGIPEYWVADLNAALIHQMWAPADEAYSQRREIAFGDRIEAVTLDGLAVETGSI